MVHGHTPEPHVLRMEGRRTVCGHHRLHDSRPGLDGGGTITGIVAGAEFRSDPSRTHAAAA